MNIKEVYLINNPCYVQNENPKGDSRYLNFQKNGPQGLMLHSVGCSQPSAEVFVKNWNKSSYDRACVHAFIDANSGDVYQCLPWNYRAWHAGGSANNTHVGVEMCEPDVIKYISGSSFTCSNREKAILQVKNTYESAVELFAKICIEYDLNPLKEGVIISHKEGNRLGIATNHGDPEHLWNGLGLDYTMNGFRKDVYNMMVKLTETETVEEPKVEELKVEEAPSFMPYIVKVAVSALNYRSGPGINYKVNGCIRDRGKYTIVEEKDGWGKLKSGKGWICLQYTEKIGNEYTTYTVKKGDTLWSIAKELLKAGTRSKELKEFNNLSSDSIYVGMKLKIPNE